MDTGSHEIVIEPGRGARHYWRDLWAYRELFAFLAWRDTLVRYKQTVIGIAWAVLRPFLTMVVFTVIFGRLAQLPSEGVPYPIMVFTALLPWQFFASAVTDGSNALLANAGMLTKIYFPRIIVPVSSIVVSLVDFFASAAVLLLLMLWYGFLPGWQIAAVPVFLFLAFIASVGFSLWVSALNVRYRDFRYIVPFIAQFGLYISPVGFSSSVVPDKWRLFYSLNPMVGVIDGFRWAVSGGRTHVHLSGMLVSAMIAVLIFLYGVRYFRRTERTFADII